MVENSGLEPLTSYVQGRRSPSWANSPYMLVGLPGLEPGTSPLSGVHSNQLSYRPIYYVGYIIFINQIVNSNFYSDKTVRPYLFLWKEVIQPQVLLRLPCYDFTLVTKSTVEGSYFSIPASNEFNSHGVTGGEYKTRERIHRSIADLRLLAIPTSYTRVAECNPNWEIFYEICSTSRYCGSLYTPL